MKTRPDNMKFDNAAQSEGDTNRTEYRSEWQQKHLSQQTTDLLAEDAKYYLHQSLSTPCLNVVDSANGIYITDIQGRRYMDFHGNQVHTVGFANPHVIDAIKTQLDQLTFSTRRYTNRVAIDFARKLTSLTPESMNKILLAPGGTNAISMAVQLARLVTGRHKVISMWDAFHGGTIDSMSLSGAKLFREGMGPLLAGVEHVPPPDEYRCMWDCHTQGGCTLKCANYIEYVMEKEGDVAAVIAEPIRSTPYIPRKEYWQRVREICDKHRALLIFDEIPHALGRTGEWFTCMNFDVVPDVLVIGKGIGGGILPLSVMITHEKYDVIGHKAIGHFTHEKNPVLCAAALATLETIEKNNIPQHAKQLGVIALERLREMQKRHPLIGDVRGLGLFLGVELVRDPVTKERATDEAQRVMYEALSRGLSFKVTMGNILSLVPALTITAEELFEALDILEASIAAIENNRKEKTHDLSLPS